MTVPLEPDRRLLELVNDTGRVFLSSTAINGRVVLRLCVLSHRTHGEHVREAVTVIRDAARRLGS